MSMWNKSGAVTVTLTLALLASAAPAHAGFLSRLVGPEPASAANDVRSRVAAAASEGRSSEVEAEPVAELDAWKPLHAFVGSWAGTKAGSEGNAHVTRGFASTPDNHGLEITEKSGGRTSIWGRVRYDQARQALLLEQPSAGGGNTEYVFDEASSNDTRVVFASVTHNPGVTRVVLERSNWNEFVERVEHAPMGQSFAVVSETKFKRKS